MSEKIRSVFVPCPKGTSCCSPQLRVPKGHSCCSPQLRVPRGHFYLCCSASCAQRALLPVRLNFALLVWLTRPPDIKKCEVQPAKAVLRVPKGHFYLFASTSLCSFGSRPPDIKKCEVRCHAPCFAPKVFEGVPGEAFFRKFHRQKSSPSPHSPDQPISAAKRR